MKYITITKLINSKEIICKGMNPKRIQIINILGGFRCKHCDNQDYRVLEIDHIFGNGKEMPLSDENILDIYLDNPHLCKTELQVLCRNCHRIKSIENGDLGRRKGEPKPVTVKKEDIPENNLDNMDWYT